MFKYLRRAANPVPAELELESDSSVETSEEASVALEEPASPLRIEAMSLDPDPDPVGVSEVGSVRPDAPLELEEPASPVRIEAMSLELGFSDGEEDPDEAGKYTGSVSQNGDQNRCWRCSKPEYRRLT